MPGLSARLFFNQVDPHKMLQYTASVWQRGDGRYLSARAQPSPLQFYLEITWVSDIDHATPLSYVPSLIKQTHGPLTHIPIRVTHTHIQLPEETPNG